MDKRGLKRAYALKRSQIINRLKEFRLIWALRNEKAIFDELVFCLLTPQSKAKACWEAVTRLKREKKLFSKNSKVLSKLLNGVRFHNNKACYICAAAKRFSVNGRPDIASKINKFSNNRDTRDWLVKNVKGLGLKEASHFLRNIGLGRGLAILDRHILKNLKLFKVIDDIPQSLTRKKYLYIEKKMERFARDIKIPAESLDLLLWCKETGEIFK